MSLLRVGLFCLTALFLLGGQARADSYKLVNSSGVPLKIQSKALKFIQSAEVKPAHYEMRAGQSKTVDFGHDFRLWFLHIYNKANLGQNHYWDRQPRPTDPHQSWTVTVREGVKVIIRKN